MFLKQVQLKNFRSITSLTLPVLKNLNCFIGGHNSGKTNILDGISVFWDNQIRSNTLHRQFQSNVIAPPKEDFDRSILSYLDSNYIYGSFDFITPKKKGLNNYLKILARLNRILQNESFRDQLFTARTSEDIICEFNKLESKT